MNNIKRGQIYYITKSPYKKPVGSVYEAGRPAIIVSNNCNNAHSMTLEVVFLTTAPKKDMPTHCTIRSAKKLSTALCEQITTVSVEQIAEYVGTCTDSEMQAVDTCIAISLGLVFEEEEYTIEDAQIDFEVEQLRMNLTKAEKEAEVYRTLYERLLAKMLQ